MTNSACVVFRKSVQMILKLPYTDATVQDSPSAGNDTSSFVKDGAVILSASSVDTEFFWRFAGQLDERFVEIGISGETAPFKDITCPEPFIEQVFRHIYTLHEYVLVNGCAGIFLESV